MKMIALIAMVWCLAMLMVQIKQIDAKLQRIIDLTPRRAGQ